MAKFDMVPYSAEYDPQIRALCRLPVSGNISLALEREPEYLTGAYVQCNHPEVYICIDKSQNLVCGVVNIGFREVYFRSAVKRCRYLCDLRIHPDYRGSSVLYRFIRLLQQSDTTLHGIPAQTIVFGDNANMLSIIARSQRLAAEGRVPAYHFAGTYNSTLLGLKQPKQTFTKYHVRQATAQDMQEMQDFIDREGAKIDYFPVYRLSQLNMGFYNGIDLSDFFLAYRSEQLVGICGVWDQMHFKQTRITAYSRSYRIIRPVFNWLAGLRRMNTLPPANSLVRYLYLHTILVENRDANILEALIKAMVNRFRFGTYDYLLCGLDEKDPLVTAFRGFNNKRTINGHYYLVNNSGSLDKSFLKNWFYLEASRI